MAISVWLCTGTYEETRRSMKNLGGVLKDLQVVAPQSGSKRVSAENFRSTFTSDCIREAKENGLQRLGSVGGPSGARWYQAKTHTSRRGASSCWDCCIGPWSESTRIEPRFSTIFRHRENACYAIEIELGALYFEICLFHRTKNIGQQARQRAPHQRPMEQARTRA